MLKKMRRVQKELASDTLTVSAQAWAREALRDIGYWLGPSGECGRAPQLRLFCGGRRVVEAARQCDGVEGENGPEVYELLHHEYVPLSAWRILALRARSRTAEATARITSKASGTPSR